MPTPIRIKNGDCTQKMRLIREKRPTGGDKKQYNRLHFHLDKVSHLCFEAG